jgi:hypothetical protein
VAVKRWQWRVERWQVALKRYHVAEERSDTLKSYNPKTLFDT